jgi:hypothetical protein
VCFVAALALAGMIVPATGTEAAAGSSTRAQAAATSHLDQELQPARASADAGSSTHTTNDLDSLTPDDAWSVGVQNVRVSAWARHWDGTRWTAVRTPIMGGAEFEGVSMLAPDDVWAVGAWDAPQGQGFGGPLIEHWDGSRWHYVRSPEPGGYTILHAVEAVSPDDVWAVGTTSVPEPHPLIEHWDGTKWREIPESAPEGEGIYSFLYGVKAVAPDDVYAVGTIDDDNTRSALIEHWDGTSWQLENLDAPSNTTLSGVDATGPNDIWAVGSYVYLQRQRCCINLYHGLIAHFDGSSWTTVQTGHQPAQTTSFQGVAAITPDDAWVVGTERYSTSRATTQHWDGTEWTRVDTANSPFPYNYLSAVTAPASDFVLAGGVYEPGSSERSLTLLWDGSQWAWVNRHRGRS